MIFKIARLATIKHPALADGALPWKNNRHQYDCRWQWSPIRQICSVFLDSAIQQKPTIYRYCLHYILRDSFFFIHFEACESLRASSLQLIQFDKSLKKKKLEVIHKGRRQVTFYIRWTRLLIYNQENIYSILVTLWFLFSF